MNPFESLQAPRCAVCGREIRALSLTWSPKHNGYICHECLEHELIDEMSENQRMKEALQKIADLCESVWEIGDGQDYDLILEYAEEGLGKLEGDTE